MIATALVAVVIGCRETSPPVQHERYSLGLAVDPPDSGTAVDVTAASPYVAGATITIRAEAADGYQFMNWTAPEGVLADWTEAETTFTMPPQDVTVTAVFFQGVLVRNWHDLHAVRSDLSGSYYLTNDLDSATDGYADIAGPAANQGRGWQPIGSRDTGFAGTFDGRGHEIRDLFIDRADEDGVGLFGVLDGQGAIRNVILANAAVTGGNYVGGLIGDNWEGTVTNCRSSGSVTGENYVGGLVGISDGTISSSYSTGSVTGDFWVGGLLGCNEGIVVNCYSTGSVTGDWGIGGLVGDNYDGTVSSSYSTGSVTGNWWNGGLVGVNTGGTVSDSFWNTMTSGMGESDGGTGKTTEAMMSIATFADQATVGLDAPWDIAAVADPSQRTPGTSWNIVDGLTYPFLSWEPVS